MKKKLDNPNIEELSKKPIFDKINDGDWYMYSQEPEIQKIVKTSAQQVLKMNDVAKENYDQAQAMLRDFLPNADDSVDIYFPITSIEHPKQLTIGKGTFINANLQILSAGKVTIGEHCFIGPNCQLYTPNHHPYDKELRRQGWQYDAPITIGNDCWFGGSVIVLPGVTIGDNVVIGAGSVVTKDIESNVIVAGNPARVVKRVDDK
jgi:maltose O-acetyltransferase